MTMGLMASALGYCAGPPQVPYPRVLDDRCFVCKYDCYSLNFFCANRMPDFLGLV